MTRLDIVAANGHLVRRGLLAQSGKMGEVLAYALRVGPQRIGLHLVPAGPGRVHAG